MAFSLSIFLIGLVGVILALWQNMSRQKNGQGLMGASAHAKADTFVVEKLAMPLVKGSVTLVATSRTMGIISKQTAHFATIKLLHQSHNLIELVLEKLKGRAKMPLVKPDASFFIKRLVEGSGTGTDKANFPHEK